MNDLEGYKLWLTNLQRQPSIINNYWSALLASEMKEHGDSFGIRYFIVEEELQKEEDNYNLDNNDDAYVSNSLRHWLVHLLKDYFEHASIHNYEELLNEFLEIENVLPPNIARPLTPSSSFHNLPTDCKFWILYALKTHKKDQVIVKTLTKDALGNSYHLIPDCRLYVRISKPENLNISIDEDKLKEEPWGQLFWFIHAHHWKLICDNKETWEETEKKLLSLKMSNLYYSIKTEMTMKMCGLSAILMARDDQRREFEERLLKMTPIPVPRTSSAIPKKKRTRVADALVRHVDIAVVESDVNSVQDKEDLHENIPLTTSPEKMTKTKTSKMKKIKCRDFPSCLKSNCPFEHPTVRCNDLPNCLRGCQCHFLHDLCQNDGYCKNIDCPDEHLQSPKTFYRKKRGAEENALSIVSEQSSARKESEQHVKTVEKATRPFAASVIGETKKPAMKKLRCQYFPQCKKEASDCPYVHPSKPCRNLIAGQKCPGQWCLFRHPICANDGTCTNLKCIYEHEKSLPVCVRKRALKKKEGSLPDDTTSNVSTCSDDELTDRMDIVDLNDDSDSSSDDTMYSVNSKLSDELHQSSNTQGRCKFGANCKSKDCNFEHVLEKCKQFPKCPHGGNCKFVHDICKNDGDCTDKSCDFRHILPREIEKKWCKFGSKCRNLDCKYIHKECIGLCPSPGKCLLRHTPAPAPFPFAFPTGYPGGFGPMPPHPPPPGIRYGYGPDFAYRPAPPPGPGFGMGTRMDPRMDPSLGPGVPPRGYGPGYPSGPGYGPIPNLASPQPPRPKTPGSQPPRSRTPGFQQPRPKTPAFNRPQPFE